MVGIYFAYHDNEKKMKNSQNFQGWLKCVAGVNAHKVSGSIWEFSWRKKLFWL